MSPNVPLEWTATRERAALLVAQDELTNDAIAAECGWKAAKTVERLKGHPDFAARVEEHRDAWRAEIRAKGIAEVQNRVDAANDRWERMQRLMDARAVQHAAIPGGDTGLLVATPLLVKIFDAVQDEAEDAHDVLTPRRQTEIVYEYAFDRALLAELRAHEEHAAKQLNQLTERKELTGKDGAPLAGASVVFVLPAKDAPPDPGVPPLTVKD